MKKMMLAGIASLAAMPLLAGLYGDTPNEKHAWAVHDTNRPNPAKVDPGAKPGDAPSDAVVLFDGTEKSFVENWSDSRGNPTKWKFVNGTMESVRNAGNICSRRQFGDCQLHVEWQAPSRVEGFGQGRGNSGVFVLGGMYEVQVLDSYETNPADMKNPNYADGQAGAVYGQNPPLVNPTRKPGEWQSYDIVFHQPVFEKDVCVHPGSFTVFLNGVLVQDHWEIEGPTWHCRRTRQERPGSTRGSIQFQDHGNPVHFRNVWVREIPSRYSNTTHGTFLADEKDVAALRGETAAKLFSGIDLAKKDARTVTALLEVVAYSKDAKYMDALKSCCGAYQAALEKLDDAGLDKCRNDVNGVWNALQVLRRNNVFEQDCPFCTFIKGIREKKGWK